MSNEFDPYLDWLKIPAQRRPPTYYDLLGLPAFTSEPDRIDAAFQKRFSEVRVYQVGHYSDEAMRLLNELTEAHDMLRDAERRQGYDTQLGRPPPPVARKSGDDVDAILDWLGPPPLPRAESLDAVPVTAAPAADAGPKRPWPPLPRKKSGGEDDKILSWLGPPPLPPGEPLDALPVIDAEVVPTPRVKPPPRLPAAPPGSPFAAPLAGPLFDEWVATPVASERVEQRLEDRVPRFWTGLFRFLLSPHVWLYTLVSAGLLATVVVLARIDIDATVDPGGAAMRLMAAVVLGTIGATSYCLVCQGVLQSSAAGLDQMDSVGEEIAEIMKDQFGLLALLGILVKFYGTLVLSAAPGLLVGSPLLLTNWPWLAAVPGMLSLCLLLPVFLLSFSETGSVFTIVSPAIRESFRSAGWVWREFYLSAVGWTFCGLVLVAVGRHWIGTSFGSLGLAWLVAILFTLLYFRLIGRLAWCCAETASAIEAAAKLVSR